QPDLSELYGSQGNQGQYDSEGKPDPHGEQARRIGVDSEFLKPKEQREEERRGKGGEGGGRGGGGVVGKVVGERKGAGEACFFVGKERNMLAGGRSYPQSGTFVHIVIHM